MPAIALDVERLFYMADALDALDAGFRRLEMIQLDSDELCRPVPCAPHESDRLMLLPVQESALRTLELAQVKYLGGRLYQVQALAAYRHQFVQAR